MPVHISAEEGYANVGADYEKGRPGYSAAAVAYLLQRLGVARSSDTRRVVDLAAGTGKFTRALLDAGVRPIAVEPVAHMRETFASTTPGVEVRDGSAEALPFDDQSVDAVVVAQAFHWFDGPRALAELHRVLKPLGGLGLVWNGQDRSVDWVGAVWEKIDEMRDDTPNAWSYEWRRAFDDTSLFTPLLSAAFAYDHQTDRAGLAARIASISFVARAPQAQRDALIAHARKVCDEAGLPERFVLPVNCYVHWCHRV